MPTANFSPLFRAKSAFEVGLMVAVERIVVVLPVEFSDKLDVGETAGHAYRGSLTVMRDADTKRNGWSNEKQTKRTSVETIAGTKI